MKKLFLFTVLVLLFACSNVSAQMQALILGYSQLNNVYEDDNVKIELIRLSLKVTNKTDKTIYIDRKSSFYYINEDAFCLFEGKEFHGKNETRVEKDIDPIAPRGSKYIATLKNPLGNRVYDAGGGSGSIWGSSKKKGAAANNSFSDSDVEFMGLIETLRFELANNERQSSSHIHLAENESFMRVRVAVNYSEEPKMENLKACSITSWISDIVMAKYFVRKQDKVVRSNSVNIQGRLLNTMHVFADSPFEYDEDVSPLDGYTITFGKGKFYVHQFNNASDGQKKGKNNDKEIVSNFEESNTSIVKTIFVWEGDTHNWVQDFTDSYAKYLQEDGMKAKEAYKEAKSEAKKAKKEQTLPL